MDSSRLEFHDFVHGSTVTSVPIDDLDSDFDSSSPQSRLLVDNIEENENQTATTKSASLWSLDYYQKLFDVDTDQVVSRLYGALLPIRGKNFLSHSVNGKPDLYGPFWVCTTLVFTIAISGNLANYLQAGASNEHYHWKYDFHAVTLSASAIFSYAWVLPLGLWAAVKWMGNQEGLLSLLDLVCVYGYSLSIYIPVSVLWVIQISWLQWVLVIVGAGLSGTVLISSIWPAVAQTGDRRFIILFIVLALHVCLAAGFMLYFFHVPPMSVKNVPSSVVISTEGTRVSLASSR